MPIDVQAALSAGAIEFSSTTPDNFASLFSRDTHYRIANDYLGQDSAVLGIEPERNLLVNPQGIADPRRAWVVLYDRGQIIRHVTIGAPPDQLLHANTKVESPNAAIVLGPILQPFNMYPGPSTLGATSHVWIQDRDSKLFWELQTELIGTEFPSIALKPQENNPKQLWVFFGPES